MVRILLVMLCCVMFSSHAWGFGPHGDGKVSNGVDTSIIPGGIPILQNIKAQNSKIPISYPSLSRRDLLPLGEVIDVEGRSWMRSYAVPLFLLGVLTPIGSLSADFGDRGVQEAIDDAKSRYGVRDVYDVRIDRKRFSVLCIVFFCIYSKVTTIVHAKGVVDQRLSVH